MKTCTFLVLGLAVALLPVRGFAQDTQSMCREVLSAKDVSQLNTSFAKHSREKDIEELRAQEKASEAEKKQRARLSVIAKTEAVKARKEWQSMALSNPADLESALAEARKPVNEYRRNVLRLSALKRMVNDGGMSRQELGDTNKEIADLEEKIAVAGTRKAEAEQTLAAAERAVERRRDPNKHLPEVTALEKKADQAQQAFSEEAKRLEGIQKRFQAAQKQQDEIRACFDQRSKQLAPLPDPKLTSPPGASQEVEEWRRLVESELKTYESLVSQQDARCRQAEGLIGKVMADADKLSADANALAGRSVPGASAPVANAAVGQKAVADANAAAQTVGQSRSRAQQLMQVACNAAGQVRAAPRHSNAPAYLVEAQRNRALAEHEMTLTSNALQLIRNAYAAAPAAAAPAAGNTASLQSELDGVNARLKTVRSQQANLYALMSGRAYQNIDNAMLRSSKSIGLLSNRTDLALAIKEYHAAASARWNAAQTMNNACRSGVANRLAHLESRLKATAGKAQQVQNAIAASGSGAGTAAPNYKQAIEGIFNNARATAEGTAKDATQAVRCEAEARNAMTVAAKSPPPPPVAGRGIKCSYTGPQGPYDVVIYDRPTCPQIAPGQTVTQTPSGPPPQMMQDFSGTWTGPGSVWQISASGMSGKWQGSWGSNSVWSGPCQQTGTHVLKCTGNGTYNDADKESTWTYTTTLNISGNSISYGTVITSANTRMKRQIPPYGDYQKGKVFNGTLTKAGR